MINIILGPPCSGKSTYIQNNRNENDIVIDFDLMANAFGSNTPHEAPKEIKKFTLDVRKFCIQNLLDGDVRSWIIHSNPDQDAIRKYKNKDANFIILDPSADECKARAEKDNRPDWTYEAIDRWYKSPPEIEGLRGMGSQTEIRGGVPAEIRENQDGGIDVMGYAAVYGERANIGGFFLEEIERGAFSEAVNRDDVVFLINHDGLPLARTRSGTLKLTDDAHGLRMETTLDSDDPDVKSIIGKMKRGDLDKMSFAFRMEGGKEEWDDSGEIPVRTIKRVGSLHDVAIVTTPAYEGTEIGLRGLEQHRSNQTKSENFNAARRRLRMKADLAKRTS